MTGKKKKKKTLFLKRLKENGEWRLLGIGWEKWLTRGGGGGG